MDELETRTGIRTYRWGETGVVSVVHEGMSLMTLKSRRVRFDRDTAWSHP